MVYNEPQYLAREAAVAVGRQDWELAKSLLHRLQDIAWDPDAFQEAALSFERDGAGDLIAYVPCGANDQRADLSTEAPGFR